MRHTIKHTVLSKVANERICTRKELQKFIWSAQGRNINEFYDRQGYYSVNIQSWNKDGLIKRVGRGVYAITADGISYLENPRKFNAELRDERSKEKIRRLESNEYRLWKENCELRRKLRMIKDIL